MLELADLWVPLALLGLIVLAAIFLIQPLVGAGWIGNICHTVESAAKPQPPCGEP
ncbi:MAG: hypothetical protein KME26_12570 [Oscillatoria princeps RMCB-10]|jgi:hypothetical protein|nr:hypothetical protein [Oscillatoria princeps RMCB-10]